LAVGWLLALFQRLRRYPGAESGVTGSGASSQWSAVSFGESTLLAVGFAGFRECQRRTVAARKDTKN
jgi:hypothetical protein